MKASEIREAILEVDDLPKQEVPIPEPWRKAFTNGTKLYVRGLTATDRATYLQEVTDIDTGQFRARNYDALLVVRTLVTDGGERVFADEDAEDLGGKSSQAIAELWKLSASLSGLGGDAVPPTTDSPTE